MIKRLIRKRHFRRKRAEMRGARKLRNENNPFFVYNLFSDLTEINLGLKKSDFPKILVGTYANISEVLLRQILLEGYIKLCPTVMRSVGSGKPFKFPLPNKWVKYIADNGVPSSFFVCRIFLLLSSMKRTIYGFAKFCILLAQRMNPVNPNCPYTVFIDLEQKHLPDSNLQKSYDIISWYNKSNVKIPKIRKIWAQASVSQDYIAPEDIIVSRTIFPKINNIKNYLKFVFRCIAALLVAVFGILRGKWWYGYLFTESINLHYVNALKCDNYAEEYFFNNSCWYYKPLWTYEVEKKGSLVYLYYFSTNMENFQVNNNKLNETYGLKIMTWNNFIVWDQQQEDYLKQYCPNATYIKIGSLYIRGIEYNFFSSNRKKIISIFDVTPSRFTHYVKRGLAIPFYYSEELNLTFLQDIIEAFNNSNWEILWKRKRIVDKKFISEVFNQKQLNLVRNKINIIDSNVAAHSLVEASDAVISLPFTSTAILGKINGIPSVYYDASGKIQVNESHGLPVLKSKAELKEWYESLSVNHMT
jgi:polysaccharide biosynthesis PFTS motif protein